MFQRLFPQRIDNTYRGYQLALWFLALLVFMRLAMSVNSIFNGYAVATSADGIPLDSYTPAAARTIVSLFALLGLSALTFSLLCVVVLVRYRSMVPLVFALLLLEHLSRTVILLFLPIARIGIPPGTFIKHIVLVLIVAGLALSTWRKADLQIQSP